MVAGFFFFYPPVFIMKKEDCVAFGHIGKTRGLKGELKFVLTADLDIPDEISLLYLLDGTSLVPYPVDTIKFQEKGGFINLGGIDTVEKAQRFVGRQLFIQSDILPEKQFTYKDLISYTVYDQLEGMLGELEDVEHFPQQWIGRIDFNGTEVLVPLNENTVVEIDAKGKKLILDLPEGLLDVYRAV